METVLLGAIIILLLAILAVVMLYVTKLTQIEKQFGSDGVQKSLVDLIRTTQDQLALTRKELQDNLRANNASTQEHFFKTNKAMHERLDKTADVIRHVSQELGKMNEVRTNVKELHHFFKSPKLRGNIGEHILQDLLSQYFSNNHFALQYIFNDGQVVDAIIRSDKGIISIDAKFPLENFRKLYELEDDQQYVEVEKLFIKDIKKHIKDISRKYIVPAEGTLDFALMYIPSETVYYQILQQYQDLQEFAYAHKVFPVSPNSFYYFLKLILLGLEGRKVEAAASRILEQLEAIRIDNEKFANELGVLTTHITNAHNALDRVNNQYSKFSNTIDHVRLLKDIEIERDA